MKHSNVNPAFACLWQKFIVFAQAATFTQPSKGAFNNPPLRQNSKASLIGVALNNLDPHTIGFATLVNQGWAIIARIQDQHLPALKQRHTSQDISQSGFILPISRMHLHRYQPPLCIDDDVALASFDALAAIKATNAPFSVVFTDWLSPIKTLGSPSRLLATRTLARNSSCMPCQVALRFNFWNTSYTVDQLGKSCGNMRHEQPVRNTYRMALMYSRICSGEVRFSGSKGKRCSHSSSFKSVGYAFLVFIPLFYLVILFFTNTL